MRVRVSRASWSLPISWFSLSDSLRKSSSKASVLEPVGISSSLNGATWFILSIGTCSGGDGETNSLLAVFRVAAVADSERAKIFLGKFKKNVIHNFNHSITDE